MEYTTIPATLLSVGDQVAFTTLVWGPPDRNGEYSRSSIKRQVGRSGRIVKLTPKTAVIQLDSIIGAGEQKRYKIGTLADKQGFVRVAIPAEERARRLGEREAAQRAEWEAGAPERTARHNATLTRNAEREAAGWIRCPHDNAWIAPDAAVCGNGGAHTRAGDSVRALQQQALLQARADGHGLYRSYDSLVANHPEYRYDGDVPAQPDEAPVTQEQHYGAEHRCARCGADIFGQASDVNEHLENHERASLTKAEIRESFRLRTLAERGMAL